jgi:hypothetical protein
VTIGGSENSVGELAPSSGNVISGNGTGVLISGTGASANYVENNIIGMGADRVTPLGNKTDGVRIQTHAGNNVVGGDGPNAISFNGGAGVYLETAGTGNLVWANSISANAGLGIDLSPHQHHAQRSERCGHWLEQSAELSRADKGIVLRWFC